MSGLKCRKQAEHVRGREVHALLQAVELRVLARLRHGELGDVHGVHVCRAAVGSVEREASRVRETVEHVLSRGKLGHCTAVVLLVQEKARLLAVLEINLVAHAVFHDLRGGGTEVLSTRRARCQRIETCFAGFVGRACEPSRRQLKAFQLACCHVVALVQAADGNAILGEHLEQHREDHRLELFHAHGQRFGDQHVVEAVHHQAREAICLREQHAAAAGIFAHDGFAVLPRPCHLALPKRAVERIVGVARDKADADLAALRQQARSQVRPLAVDHVDEAAVGNLIALPRRALHEQHLGLVHPRMPLGQRMLALRRDGGARIRTLSFHEGPFGNGGYKNRRWRKNQRRPLRDP